SQMAGVPQEEQWNMVAGNAIKFFRLDHTPDRKESKVESLISEIFFSRAGESQCMRECRSLQLRLTLPLCRKKLENGSGTEERHYDEQVLRTPFSSHFDADPGARRDRGRRVSP